MKLVIFIFLTALAAFFCGCYPEPVADFEYSFTDNVAPAEVSFTNLSTDADDYRWNFGDGNTSTAPSPTHTYNEGGNFTITLKAEGRGGESTAIKSISIDEPYTYSIQNLSSYPLYNITSYYWDGEEIWDFVEHGTLNSGYQTSVTATKYDERSIVLKIESNLPYDNDWYFVSNTYYLVSKTVNYLAIDDNTVIDGPYDLKKGSPAEVHPRLRENANPVPIRDIITKQ
jgi:PKD repeat protein